MTPSMCPARMSLTVFNNGFVLLHEVEFLKKIGIKY